MKTARISGQIRVFAAFVVILSLLCLLSGCGGTNAETDVNASQAQNVTLENYGLNIQVQSRHRMVVTETLTVHYDEKISGIIREIPYEGYRFDPAKNEVIQYRMVLDQIESDTDYTVHKQAGKAYLTIDGSEIGKGGTQIYTLKYRLSYYQDTDSTQDLLYCNLLPYGWANAVNAANISITMPKDFEQTGIQMYRYAGGKWAVSDIAYTVSGKSISVFLKTEDIQANPQLSMQIKLPEGYFKGEKSLIPMQIFFYALIAVIVIGVVVLWWMFGRPVKTAKAETVEKHKLTPIEDAYLLRGTVSETDVAAFLTYWANNGIVRIIQLSGSDYSITCLAPLDKGAKSFEFTLYDALFGDGVKTHTAGAAAARIRRCLPKLKRQAARQCASLCGGRLHTLESGCVKYTALLFSVLPTLIVLAVGGHLMLDYSAGYMGLISSATLLLSYSIILVLKKNWKNMQKLFRVLFLAICTVLELTIFGGMIYYAFSTLHIGVQLILALFASLVMLGVSLLSGRKSSGYQMQLSQLLAYKRYLKNPQLGGVNVSDFYHTRLPQAYVMRIGKLFSKKCDAYPLYAGDNLVFRGDTEKLSHAAGYYPSYQHFIGTMYRAEYEPVAQNKPKWNSGKTGAAKKETPKDAPKPSGMEKLRGFFAMIGAAVVSGFHAAAVWINERIDWIEDRIARLKNRSSGGKTESDESEENED